MMDMDKQTLRTTLLKQRDNLTPKQVCNASRKVMEFIRTLPRWKDATEALIYWPIRGEIDLRPLVTELWQRDCRVLLPRCHPGANGKMDLACATCEGDLTPGPFSIMEPDAEKCPPKQDFCPDIALIPGVGFDRAGNRLGFGGGYYDRLLTTANMQNTLTVGIGYDFQFVGALPTEPWDKPMHTVCTDKELWRP